MREIMEEKDIGNSFLLMELQLKSWSAYHRLSSAHNPKTANKSSQITTIPSHLSKNHRNRLPKRNGCDPHSSHVDGAPLPQTSHHADNAIRPVLQGILRYRVCFQTTGLLRRTRLSSEFQSYQNSRPHHFLSGCQDSSTNEGPCRTRELNPL